ncbi:DNase, TatD family [Granulibacter bethesdensis]|uniref:DNase, TatD family n=1 Tax=Granulibacter bethesdensis TaxID=364410 RepID=A0AAC9K9V9_9PROT|nr:TatD family hydrolase [Granulibacter bethesdensis]APH54357.1 DNase, TatD family [Granulibacter bethesdensis]APH61942.1 DNase, TatD family [Granulibacter bethesdensis]
MLIDSHCHLDYFEAELPDLLSRAQAAGVGEMVTISVRLSQTPWLIACAEAHPGVWCTIGVHPQHAHEEAMPEVADLVALTRHPKVVGIGESGLDYFYDRAPVDVQKESFRRHIHAARETGLPLCIHARDADDDIASLLEEEHRNGAFPFLLHCFSSGRGLAERAAAIGGYFSLSGILTFPKSTELRAIVADLPSDRLLLETDSPYLAPAPHRGKRNEPAYMARTAETLASVRSVSVEEIAALTTANFRRLFKRTT